MKKKTTEFRLVVGFVSALMLLFLAGGLMFRSLQEHMRTMHWIEHTYQVREKLNAVMSTLREMESSLRGYVITHENNFIADYKFNSNETRSSLVQIKQLTIDNADQQSRCAILSKQVEKRIQLMDRTVVLFDAQGLTSAHDFLSSNVSRINMEETLAQINIMENAERALLKHRIYQAEQNANQALKMGSLLVAAALTGLILLWWRLKRGAQTMDQAELVVHESEQLRNVFNQLKGKNVELENAMLVVEKANLAKSEFLSSMSHELRSPLNAILGFAQLMESDSPPPSYAQNESIHQILKAGWHLLTLINEILDLAKVESGHMTMSQEPVSLSEILSECHGMVEPRAQQRGIRMIFPPPDIQWYIQADLTRVKQVLINLLSNAIKYNSEHGTVEVTCSIGPPDKIRISIKDSGAGLTSEQLAQLFQPFNRLGQEAGIEEGTGIGLVVAKRLIELMGGIIGVESIVGVGSVFWFELNSVAEPHFSADGATIATLVIPHVLRETNTHTLLYVEDNPANLKLVEQIIARQPDIILLTAVNGTLGVEIACSKQPDVILMDINMPGISGLEALKILQKNPATAHIPVIAVTANAMPLDIESGMKAGFFSYITKPIKVDQFIGALDEALEFVKNRVAIR